MPRRVTRGPILPARPGGGSGLGRWLPFLVCWLLWGSTTPGSAGSPRGWHPTRVLVKYRAGAENLAAQRRIEGLDCHVRRRFPMFPRLAVLETAPQRIGLAGVPDARARRMLEERIEVLRRTGLFEFVEADPLLRASSVPTDGAFANGALWGLRNLGDAGGVAGTDIGATEAWGITTGSTNVIVAILDTGVRYTHVELAAQMWRNPAEIPDNRVDDDHNGYVDDVFGIDAIAESGNPADDEGHGTHVAGTIGAAANDGHPHVGVAWQVRLLAAKFLDASGEGYTSDALECIDYAVAQGARLINASWGGDSYSQALHDALATGAARNILFVAAAGNDGADNDLVPSYPANFALDNVISVAAIDRADKLAPFSNHGRNSVHLAAPGAQIFSATGRSDGGYATLDGTSMAAPHVTGAAALLLAHYPEASVVELRQRLLTTVVPTPALAGTTVSGGRLQAFHALRASADGELELATSPASGSPVVAGRSLALRVRVSDLAQVTRATVVALTEEGANLPLVDDGMPPDLHAGDATYSGWLPTPPPDATLGLTLVVQAEGKTTAVLQLAHPLVSPPANDDFERRASLSGSGVDVVASNRGATREPDEPGATTLNPGGASVWWSWQAPEDGILTLDTNGSDFDTLLAIYAGDALPDLVRLAGDDDSGLGGASSVTLFVQRGVTYPIVVDGFSGSSGEIRLRASFVTPPPPPANDDFPQAFVLESFPDTVHASTLSATREPGEPRHAGNGGGGSVWWSWTAPASGLVKVGTDGSNFDTLLAVYVGTSLSELALVRSDDESGDGSRSLLFFEATAGTTYRIAVDGYNGAFGQVRLTLALDADPPPPANDGLESAIPLSGTELVTTGTNRGASRQDGEPDHAGNAGGRSVWWSWTSPAEGRVTVSTAGSDFDTLLAAYAGTDASSLVPLAGNDQDPSGGDTSRLSFRVAAGRTCLLVVDGHNRGFGAARGHVVLSLVLEPPPPPADNDDFERRSPLAGWSHDVVANNETATREIGEPVHANKPGDRSLWWTWTAPGDGQATVTTDGSDFDTVLAVYRGTVLGGLVPVAADDDGGSGVNSLATFPITRDAVYAVVVDGYRGRAGAIRLRVSAEPDPPAPANDAFAQRAAITDPTVPVAGTTRGASREPGEPPHRGQPVGHSIWWTWTAPTNALLTLDARDSDFETLLAVYTGATLSGLVPVGASPNPGPDAASRIDLEVRAGETYQIAVDGAGTATGTVRLSLGLGPVARPRIEAQPRDRGVELGSITAFTVRAASPAPVRYRWRRNGIPLAEEPGRLFGTASPQLVLLNVRSSDLGTYAVEVSNSAGATLSEEAALRLPAPFRLLVPSGPPGSGAPFEFRIEGLAGRAYGVETSSNLTDWIPLGTFPGGEGAVVFEDPDRAGHGQRFYRARSGSTTAR